jgi:hypothetical protein
MPREISIQVVGSLMGRMKDGRLQWTEEDTKKVEEYLKSVKAGKSRVITLPLDGTNLRDFFDNAKSSDFSCGRCGHNGEESMKAECKCPCHWGASEDTDCRCGHGSCPECVCHGEQNGTE